MSNCTVVYLLFYFFLYIYTCLFFSICYVKSLEVESNEISILCLSCTCCRIDNKVDFDFGFGFF